MERSVKYFVNGKWSTIPMDQCYFCIHYDKKFTYEKCKYADYGDCSGWCAGYTEITEDEIRARYRILFEQQ